MLVDGEPGGQELLVDRPDRASRSLGEALAERVDQPLLGDVLAAGPFVATFVAENATEGVGDGVFSGDRHDVGRCPLEHRHVLRGLRHRRQQGDRGGAATDHDHSFAGVIEVLRPMLRVDDLTGKAFAPFEVRSVALVIPVIAGPGEDPVGLDRDVLTGVGPVDLHRPERLLRRPRRRHDAMVVPDVLGEPVLLDRLLQVGQDPRGIGDGLLVAPRLELVAKGVQIAVGANTRIAEQIPRPAGRRPRLDDRERLRRESRRQIVTRADTGDPGPDHEHVHGFGRGSCRGSCRWHAASCWCGLSPTMPLGRLDRQGQTAPQSTFSGAQCTHG